MKTFCHFDLSSKVVYINTSQGSSVLCTRQPGSPYWLLGKICFLMLFRLRQRRGNTRDYLLSLLCLYTFQWKQIIFSCDPDYTGADCTYSPCYAVSTAWPGAWPIVGPWVIFIYVEGVVLDRVLPGGAFWSIVNPFPLLGLYETQTSHKTPCARKEICPLTYSELERSELEYA